MLLKDLRDEPVQLLELGVQNGGSLEIWRKYFHHYEAQIFGVDIDNNICKLIFPSGVKTFCFDLASEEIHNWRIGREFDIIIDDASHINSHMTFDFTVLFQNLRPGGIYIIEDVHASYWTPKHLGGLRKPESAIEFFKLIIDIIHMDYIQQDDVEVFHKDYIEVFGKDLVEYYINWIKSIRFEDSMIIITKHLSAQVESLKRVQSGKLTPTLDVSKPEYLDNTANFL